MRFYIKTLGCKVNQVESVYIIESLKDRGWSFCEEAEAEVLILNSCVVTAKAESECKKILKKWRRFSSKLIIIAGCYPQAYPEKLLKWAIENKFKKLLILGQEEKYRIFEIANKFLNLKEPKILVSDILAKKECEKIRINEFLDRSRGFIKIQDGCNSFCSYCIVPYARGKERSVPEEEILVQIKTLIEKGYEEIVLTGIHLGRWGKDLIPKRKLTDLLWQIEKLFSNYDKDLILRLSSLEVTEIDRDFLEFIKSSAFIAPHFHIPLQSGSDRVLKLMNRPYTSDLYLKTVEKIYEIFPHATIGADVIVGFPSETEEDFKQTYNLIERSPLNWLHVFPYSEREKTIAQKITPKVPDKVIKERVKILINLFKEKRKKFLQKEIGSVRKAIVEGKSKDLSKIKALSENYIPILIENNNPTLKIGKIFKVKFEKLIEDQVIGKVL